MKFLIEGIFICGGLFIILLWVMIVVYCILKEDFSVYSVMLGDFYREKFEGIE